MVDRLKVDADLASDGCGGAGIVAGDHRDEIVTVRMAVIAVASLTAAAVAIAVTALSFDAVNWPVFATANIMVALTYAAIGVIIGPLFGRLGGLSLLLLLPFVDIGLAQDAMFDAAPPTWGRYLPAHFAVRVMMDGAFTATFDEASALVLAIAWLAALGAAAVAIFRRVSMGVLMPVDRGTGYGPSPLPPAAGAEDDQDMGDMPCRRANAVEDRGISK